ncbi:GIP, partial [Symbiodinium pilosum]
YRDPVCPLRLALYGHPDAGGIWEKHCETQLKSVGWIPILPEIWQSVFYHPELELMLVVYVDDFKMAGPTKNMAQGWKDINSVIDMDPPEALGRREDFWEVDFEAGAVVRHHVYPRKKLYVPTEDDVLAFPMMGTSRVTEFDSKEELHVDDFNQGGEAKFDWWTGRTYFPLDREIPVEDFTYALASYKKKNPRSKTARIAKPVDPDKEPTGKLAGIASRILMKVLFAARVARWDLLRATQALASR